MRSPSIFVPSMVQTKSSLSVSFVVRLLNGFAGVPLIFVMHVIEGNRRGITSQRCPSTACRNARAWGSARSVGITVRTGMRSRWAVLCVETTSRTTRISELDGHYFIFIYNHSKIDTFWVRLSAMCSPLNFFGSFFFMMRVCPPFCLMELSYNE